MTRANPKTQDTPGKKNAFVYKLYRMLNDQSISHLIWWSGNPKGHTFQLSPSQEFCEALTKYFKHRNVASFVRQLHMYGFHKVSDSLLTHSAQGPMFWEFRHASGKFRQGNESMLSHIKRRLQSSSQRHFSMSLSRREVPHTPGNLAPAQMGHYHTHYPEQFYQNIHLEHQPSSQPPQSGMLQTPPQFFQVYDSSHNPNSHGAVPGNVYFEPPGPYSLPMGAPQGLQNIYHLPQERPNGHFPQQHVYNGQWPVQFMPSAIPPSPLPSGPGHMSYYTPYHVLPMGEAAQASAYTPPASAVSSSSRKPRLEWIADGRLGPHETNRYQFSQVPTHIPRGSMNKNSSPTSLTIKFSNESRLGKILNKGSPLRDNFISHDNNITESTSENAKSHAHRTKQEEDVSKRCQAPQSFVEYHSSLFAIGSQAMPNSILNPVSTKDISPSSVFMSLEKQSTPAGQSEAAQLHTSRSESHLVRQPQVVSLKSMEQAPSQSFAVYSNQSSLSSASTGAYSSNQSEFQSTLSITDSSRGGLQSDISSTRRGQSLPSLKENSTLPSCLDEGKYPASEIKTNKGSWLAPKTQLPRVEFFLNSPHPPLKKQILDE